MSKLWEKLYAISSHHHLNNFSSTKNLDFKCVSCDLPSTQCLVWIYRAIPEMNEEVTTYLQEFPKFHTSNLHLLDSIGQGKKMCEQVCCILDYSQITELSRYKHAWSQRKAKISFVYVNNQWTSYQTYICYTKSSTAQSAFWTVPGLISCAGMTG